MNGPRSLQHVALTGSLLLVGVLLAANAVVFLVARHHLHADALDRVVRALDSLAIGQLVAVPVAVVLIIFVVRRIVVEARISKDRSSRLLADAAHQLRTPVAAALAANQALLWDVGTYSLTDREGLLLHVQRELARSARVVDRLLRLREALSNYLDNARRHAHSTVTVSVKRQAHQVTVAVADDGPGPTRPSDELFARFATFGTHGGSGLGLAVTRAIARAHGGDAQFRDGWFMLRIPSGSPQMVKAGAAGMRGRQLTSSVVHHRRRMLRY